MSAQEFAEWFVYLSHEELLPVAERIRHAQMRATVFNAGGVKPPRGRAAWSFEDFMQVDAWPEPQPAIVQLPLAQQIALWNRRFK